MSEMVMAWECAKEEQWVRLAKEWDIYVTDYWDESLGELNNVDRIDRTNSQHRLRLGAHHR